MIQYLILSLILFFFSLVYFKIANKFNIIDKPNHRSAHTEITLRGGGIIFWFAGLLYTINDSFKDKYFFIALTVMCGVSFWDDIKSLPNKIRIVAHFIAISLIFYNLNFFHNFSLFIVLIGYVFFIGIINAYNFMDGINGITGIYSVVVLASLYYVNEFIIHFEESSFILYPIVASLVFLFFNFRRKAKCFAGDIGSIGMAFWIVFLLLKLILISNSIIWLLFLAVYGADSGCTILHRLYLKENIFVAHRHHFYQILSNEYKVQHRVISTLYGFLQLLCSFIVILFYGKLNELSIYIIIIIPLVLLYSIKFYLIGKLKHNG